MLFHRIRCALLSLASCSFLSQPLLVQTTSSAQAQTAKIYPVVRPGAWTGSYASFPTAEEACQHIANNDRGGRRVLRVELYPPVENWLGLLVYSGATCNLENWGGEPTQVFCPDDHPPYDPYVYIGGTKGVCVLSSVFQKPELTPYVRDAAAKGVPIEPTPEFLEAVNRATGATEPEFKDSPLSGKISPDDIRIRPPSIIDVIDIILSPTPIGEEPPLTQLPTTPPEEVENISLNADKAPGKPTEEDGYYPPKRWDGKKIKSPNGPEYGWPDENGDVWIPSGPAGHGGPHWDVQTSGGGYKNVYPGGKIR